jgi:hypothetical protein
VGASASYARRGHSISCAVNSIDISLATNFWRAKKKIGLARHGWMKLKEDFVKLNVDAGFHFDSGSGSSRAIIRD